MGVHVGVGPGVTSVGAGDCPGIGVTTMGVIEPSTERAVASVAGVGVTPGP